jgi:hypothetical protein
MTAAERQRLERERNRRAREIVIGLSTFALNACDWEELRDLSRIEILNTLYLVSKWGTDGQDAEHEWRLTLSPDRRAYVSKVFERLNIQIPFCTSCGSDLKKTEADGLRRCGCWRRQSDTKSH